jgi:hypothetical protein
MSEGVESLPDKLKADALEAMLFTAGWQVTKWYIAQMAKSAKQRIVSATNEFELARAAGEMAALERVAQSIEQAAITLKK